MPAVKYYFRSGITAKVLTMSEITTDRFGLSTGSVTLQYPYGTYSPGRPSGQHPYAGYLHAEKESMRRARGWDIVTISYVGIFGTTTNPVFGIRYSLSQEPIETHRLFSSYAGSQKAPKNGAFFDANGTFVGFQGPGSMKTPTVQAPLLQGIKSWLMPGCSVVKKYFTSRKPTVGDVGEEGSLFPDCPFRVTNGGTTEWLIEAPVIDVRGKVFEVTESRLMSGPKGLSPFYKPSPK